MSAPAVPAPGALTQAEEARLASLIESVLAAPSPQEAMLHALAELVDREQLPALAARLFESLSWRVDMRSYWICFRMARAYGALGPARDDAALLMASLAAQLGPGWSGTNQLFSQMFAILRRRGDWRAAVDVFLAGAELVPERPPAEPHDARPVFAAAGVRLPGDDRPQPNPQGRRTHRVVESAPRPPWTCPAFGGDLPYALRPLAAGLPRPAIDVVELQDAEVLLCEDTVVVRDRDGVIDPNLSVSRFPELVQRKLDRLAAAGTPPRSLAVDAAVLIGDRFPEANLCHFLLDQITRLALYRRAGVEIGAVSVIGPQPVAAFQRRILERAGVAAERVIGSRQVARVRVGRLWVSSNCHNLQHAADLGAPWAVEYARSLLGGQGERGWRRLYISRGDVPTRRVANEAEVVELLDAYGFETIQPGLMPYDLQVAAFRQASHVIAPHGAALTHLIACPPGAHVLEMFHPLYGTAAFAMQAAESRLQYAAMTARDFQFDTPEWNVPREPITFGSTFLERHMRVDLPTLHGYLSMVL